ncbi:MAG: hypothetical protein IKG83_03155 [Prevotella sp.]|nr:hypothetical protein [Prevotella sp.]
MKRENIIEVLCGAVRGADNWRKGWAGPGEKSPGTRVRRTELDETLEKYFKAEGIGYTEMRGDVSGYAPGSDNIILPLGEQFYTDEYYHATKAHEAIHSTGAYVRCDREIENPFGSYRYAKEELTAEIGALFLLADYGLDITKPLENTMAYVQSWSKRLQCNPRWVRDAAKAAAEAVEYIEDYE